MESILKLNHITETKAYMDALEKLMEELNIDEDKIQEILEENREGPSGLYRNPRPMKKRKINKEGDYVVTKSRRLLKDQRNQNSSQH